MSEQSDVVARIEEFRSLAADWDSYGSRPIADRAIREATAFVARVPTSLLEDLWAVPTPPGGVGFEMHARGWTVVIDVDDQGRWGYFVTDHASYSDERESLDQDVMVASAGAFPFL